MCICMRVCVCVLMLLCYVMFCRVVYLVEKRKLVYPQAWSRRWKRFIRRYQSSFHSMTIERGPIPTVPEGLSMSLPKIKYDLEQNEMRKWEKEKTTHKWTSETRNAQNEQNYRNAERAAEPPAAAAAVAAVRNDGTCSYWKSEKY